MIRTILITLLVFTSTLNLHAADSLKDKEHMHHGPDHNHKMGEGSASIEVVNKDKAIVKVQGMVCAFCAQGIKKNFNKRSEVKDTVVDLDNMKVTIHFQKGKMLSEKIIQKIVTDAGFKFIGVE